MQGEEFTKEEITDAYLKLLWVQGLIDFVLCLNICVNIEDDRTAGFISMFNILQDYIKPAAGVLDNLDTYYEDKFSALGETEKTEGGKQ